MANQKQNQDESRQVVDGQVRRLLDNVPAYQQLDPASRQTLSDSMSKIVGYMAGVQEGPSGTARQLSPDLRQALAPRGGQRPGGGPPSPATTPEDVPQQAASGRSGGVTGQVGAVARATLQAIDFPGFVASLIQGTFQAIVDSSIQQMEAYAELVQNVAGTVDRFMSDHVTDGTARDYLADRYDTVFTRDTSRQEPRLTINSDGVPEGEMPEFFKDLGFDAPDDIDEQAIDEVIVPATRRTLAEQRQQLLATMVLMGINRVVVDDGEINAKLQFHIDASESTELRFDQQKTSFGTMARAGRSPFSAQGILVNTTSLNTQSDMNVRTDLTGQVKVRFRSETFPLERFADSAAIQLINNSAHVPQPNVGEQQNRAEPAGNAPPAPNNNDPWAPR